MCTRTLYVGAEDLVITGRNMDWKEDMHSNLWLLPAGLERDGAAGPDSLRWTSLYGSVIVTGYEAGTTDGMNEKGLVANILYLAESDYGAPGTEGPFLSIALWAQYVLDRFATVAETVAALEARAFVLLAPILPNGSPATLHLSVSDASGDSAIFEYIDGELTIHHGREHVVMTNSPPFAKQLALNEYWRAIGGLTFLPGTNNAADRFVRAAFLLGAIPRDVAPAYVDGIPGRSLRHQALASMLSLQRAVSVPLGITTPDHPNISSTIWRTIADQTNRVYCFDSATRPNVFWVALDKVDFAPGTPVRKLTIADGAIFAGEVSAAFVPAALFHPLPAQPPARDPARPTPKVTI